MGEGGFGEEGVHAGWRADLRGSGVDGEDEDEDDDEEDGGVCAATEAIRVRGRRGEKEVAY